MFHKYVEKKKPPAGAGGAAFFYRREISPEEASTRYV